MFASSRSQRLLFLSLLAIVPALGGARQCEPPDGGGACTLEYAPVCGVDGVTYGNACGARRAGVEIAHEGECETRNLCMADADCGAGEVCNHDECLSPCEPGEICPAVCYGACEPRGACPPVLCDLYCEDGFRVGDDGCQICACAEPSECRADADCGEGEHCEEICLHHCEAGDSSCCSSRCVADEPPPPGGCTSDADCGRGHHCEDVCLMYCEVDDPGCCGGSCVPDEPLRACWSDEECHDGERCNADDHCLGGCDDSEWDCLAVCYGACERVEPRRLCLVDESCGDGARCNTEDHCLSGCEESDEVCTAVCYGLCEAHDGASL